MNWSQLYYRPLLPDGSEAVLPWEIRFGFWNVHWPISENADWTERLIKFILIILSALIILYIFEAEANFIYFNRKDIGIVLEAVAPIAVLIECHLRIFHMAWHSKDMRDLIKDFYLNIFIETQINPDVVRSINRTMISTRICSVQYCFTALTYSMVPIIGLYYHQHLIPYRMLFHYDLDNWAFYLPTLLMAFWAGISVISHLCIESNLLALMILHLNYRYIILQKDVEYLYERISIQTNHSQNTILGIYKKGLVAIIQRNSDLNEFATKFKNAYSYRIFIMLSFSAVLLCAISFKAITVGLKMEVITYGVWYCAKVIELLVFGQLGSTLVATTDKISSMYYMSNWEKVVAKSQDRAGNVKLMKLIVLAINLNHPIVVTGLNFFDLSLETIIRILQGAFSYFTCLYAFR